MRGMGRSVVVVCLLAVSVAAFAGPREREPRGGGVAGKIGKVVKKIKALGDLITIPGVSPTP